MGRGEGELEAEHAGAEHDDPLTVGDGAADALRVVEIAQGGHAAGEHVVVARRRGGAGVRGTPFRVGTFARDPVASTTRS